MAATAKIQVTGVRETIAALNKIEPGLRKQFRDNAQRIAQPAIREVQDNYVEVPLSGMERRWNYKGRRLFPFDVNRARRGVVVSLDTRRNAISVINIRQKDAGTAVFEAAGRATTNPLGASLGKLRPNRTRIIGPAVFRRRRQITSEMERYVRATMDRVQREVR